MKRRAFLKFTAASAASMSVASASLFSWQRRAYAATISKTVYITDGLIEQPDGTDVYFRGFSSNSNRLHVPGESIVVQEGDTVNITIHNTLGTSHSFVIDGLVNSGRIRPGNSTSVQFIAQNPGTYLYYDERNSPYNRVTGLHGGFAVMPAGSSSKLYDGSPSFTHQKFWVFNETDPRWNSAVSYGSTPSSSFVPRYFTLNGLNGRPPGVPGNGDPSVDAMHDPRSALHGHIGDRTLIRMLNAGMAKHSVHTHANHMEWLTQNGSIRPDIWLKDIVPLDADKGITDVIFPFEIPPDSWPRATTGAYPMHLHDEMTQTAGGGLYMFGAMTDIFFE